MSYYLYDANHTRLHLSKSVPGESLTNWLFIPGGPGVDSSSMSGLVDCMNLPGNYWLVDFLSNGTHQNDLHANKEICLEWPRFLEQLVSQFDNPVVVGHSFGGYLPLFCPELEHSLKALIILNSIPSFNSDLFAKIACEKNLPSLTEAQTKFAQDPSLNNMKALYVAEADYFFSAQKCAEGLDKIINKLQFCLDTEHWWYAGGYKHFADITWIPATTPTLIIGGEDDAITPLAVFKQDLRFHRSNIKMIDVPDAGHFPWFEQPVMLNKTLGNFMKAIKSENDE